MVMSRAEVLEKKRQYYREHRNEKLQYQKIYQETHLEQHNQNSKNYVRKNKLRRRKTKREYMRRLRLRILKHYSNGTIACAFCGTTDLRVLSIDHVESDGAKHRKEVRGTIYEWLLSHKFPKGFQVLCMNCQFVKRHTHKENRTIRPVGQTELFTERN